MLGFIGRWKIYLLFGDITVMACSSLSMGILLLTDIVIGSYWGYAVMLPNISKEVSVKGGVLHVIISEALKIAYYIWVNFIDILDLLFSNSPHFTSNPNSSCSRLDFTRHSSLRLTYLYRYVNHYTCPLSWKPTPIVWRCSININWEMKMQPVGDLFLSHVTWIHVKTSGW